MLEAAGTNAPTDAALRNVLIDAAAVQRHERFLAAVDDDLDFPSALKVLHETLSDEAISPAGRFTLVSSWDEILGLDLAKADRLAPELERLVAEREEARQAGDYARADEIRDRLRSSGVELLDSGAGTRWVKR
jgi:cysteinyl-tRNA synthetase